jgi:arylformamidase
MKEPQDRSIISELEKTSHHEKIKQADTQAPKSKYYDLTTHISERTVVFPGDPEYSMQKVCSIDEGNSFNLCHMQLGNHTGTHIDYPAHVIKEGKTSSDFSIDHLIGSGIIIKVPDTEKSITKSFITEQSIMNSDIVFFKTANSKLSKQDKFKDNYVYIEPEAAEELLRKQVRIIGIDYISVDKYDAEDLPVHKSLLSNEVLIVEGLELNNAPIGRCEIYIMPLNISNMDGLPVRVVAKV